MKHLVFCWELGAGYGHISAFMQIAEKLRKQGVKVSWILRNLEFSHLIREQDKDAIILQAPRATNTNHKKEATLSYSHIISFLGFNDKNLLCNLINSWRHSLDLLKADMIVSDHSPSALIAAKTLGIPSTMIGTGFFSPPRIDQMPQFCVFKENNQKKLTEIDKNLVESINFSLKYFGQNPINRVADIFSVEEDFLCTFAELDHYPERKNAGYWGASFSIEMGKPYQYQTNKYKVFAYLKNNTKCLADILSSLNAMDVEAVIHIPKANHAQLSQQYPNLTITEQPVQMKSVLAQADLVICNSSHGTVAATLLAGVRLLAIPNQLEQSMLAQLLSQRGLCVYLPQSAPKLVVQKTLNELKVDKNLKQNSERFSEFYKGYDTNMLSDEIVDRCLEILE